MGVGAVARGGAAGWPGGAGRGGDAGLVGEEARRRGAGAQSRVRPAEPRAPRPRPAPPPGRRGRGHEPAPARRPELRAGLEPRAGPAPSRRRAAGAAMQRPGEPGAARFGPPEVCADHPPHRYRSFMIEEILTEPPGPKGAAPAAAAAAAAGELLKFGVQALLAARPFHSHLGTCGPGRGSGRAASRTRLSTQAGTGPWARSGGKPSGRARRSQASCPRAGLAWEGVGALLSCRPAASSPEESGPGTRALIHSATQGQTGNVKLRVEETTNAWAFAAEGRSGVAVTTQGRETGPLGKRRRSQRAALVASAGPRPPAVSQGHRRATNQPVLEVPSPLALP